MKPILSTKEAATLVGVSRSYFDELVKRGYIPEDCYFELPNLFGNGQRKRLRFLTDKIIEFHAVQEKELRSSEK